VAADINPVAVGSDTGGSLRIPAALCGVSALRPTYGSIPSAGVLPLAPSFDTLGPIGRSAEDCAVLLEALTGRPVDLDPALPADRSLAGVRIGVIEPPGGATRAFNEGVGVFASLGAVVRYIDDPHGPEVTAAVHALISSESYAVHASDLADAGALYGASAREILGAGQHITADHLSDARAVLTAAASRVKEMFEAVDVFVTPTVTTGAPELAGLDLAAILADIKTVEWSALALPVASIPIRPTPARLPLGMQVIGPSGMDARVLAVGRAFQSVTDWHDRSPALAGDLQASARPSQGV
jgi:aspartyl-tRNA(Asn)/glutamyl-tRNA(Gln) amidotransferase subunit A